jgi:hypothetical protein
MSRDGWVLLASYPNAALARIAQEHLVSHDVPAIVEGGLMDIGVGGDQARVRVLVERDRLADARVLLRDDLSAAVDEEHGATSASALASLPPPDRALFSRFAPWSIALLCAGTAAYFGVDARDAREQVALFHYTAPHRSGHCWVYPQRENPSVPSFANCDDDGDGKSDRRITYARGGELKAVVTYRKDGEPATLLSYDKQGRVRAKSIDDDGDDWWRTVIEYDRFQNETGRDVADESGRHTSGVQNHESGNKTVWLDLDNSGYWDHIEVRDKNGNTIQRLVVDEHSGTWRSDADER